MTGEEVMAAVESEDLAITANIANDLATFRTALDSSQAFRELVKFVGSQEGERAVSLRLIDLISEAGDPRYRHKHDVALAAYLDALGRVRSDWLGTLRSMTLKARSAWWAKRIAEDLAESREPSGLFEGLTPMKFMVIYDAGYPVRPGIASVTNESDDWSGPVQWIQTFGSSEARIVHRPGTRNIDLVIHDVDALFHAGASFHTSTDTPTTAESLSE